MRARECRTLLQIALDVVMTKRGSYERHPQNQISDIADLKTALLNWKPSDTTANFNFDERVRSLLRAALDEETK